MNFKITIKGGKYNEEKVVLCRVQENNEVQLILDNDSFGECRNGIFDIPSQLSFNGIKYVASSLRIQCKSWNLNLPKTIKSICIHRDRQKEYGSAENSCIYLKNDVTDFSSNKDFGCLYSKDMKTLFHLHRETSSQNIELESQIKNISPGSIYFKESVEKLIIPEGVRELKADAIHGNIREVIFLGQLNHIEKGALQNIYRRNGDCTIKINGLLSDLDNEGLNEIKEWTEKHYTHNVIFVAPKPCGRGLIGNGFIELSEVISSKVKLALGADTRPISINADINKGVVIQDGNETEINNVPIIINRTKTSEKDTFSPVDVTKIRFAKNEISFCVHEDYEMVEKLIRQSYNGIN